MPKQPSIKKFGQPSNNYRFAEAITLDTTMSQPTDAIWVTTAGNLNCLLADSVTGEEVTIPVVVGLAPLAVKRVNTSGTTAVALALYQ